MPMTNDSSYLLAEPVTKKTEFLASRSSTLAEHWPRVQVQEALKRRKKVSEYLSFFLGSGLLATARRIRQKI